MEIHLDVISRVIGFGPLRREKNPKRNPPDEIPISQHIDFLWATTSYDGCQQNFGWNLVIFLRRSLPLSVMRGRGDEPIEGEQEGFRIACLRPTRRSPHEVAKGSGKGIFSWKTSSTVESKEDKKGPSRAQEAP